MGAHYTRENTVNYFCAHRSRNKIFNQFARIVGNEVKKLVFPEYIIVDPVDFDFLGKNT